MSAHLENSRSARFENSYLRLPQVLYVRQAPVPVRAPAWVIYNAALGAELGLDPAGWQGEAGLAVFAGNRVPAGAEPVAQAYAGHQFGHFVPQLGDGRALLLGERVGGQGVRRDIALKGSGPTPFSRGGDGRAGLGPVLREYLISEAMFALGIPTTRSLAAVTTGETVTRQTPTPGPAPGAVLTRVAASHLRVGTFEYVAARGDHAASAALRDYALARHFPEAAAAACPALALLTEVLRRQATLVARWLGVGFIHGVINTDNTTISGETIDYGPCAFLDSYDPATVFSAIDRYGRYAYGAQPAIIGWNMARLADALLPLIDPDPARALERAQETLAGFPALIEGAWLDVMRAKIGLQTAKDDDRALVLALLEAMQAGAADYTNTFRALAAAAADPADDPRVRAAFSVPERYDEWAVSWRARLAAEDTPGDLCRSRMQQVNPAFIPRNHRVEAALQAAVEANDLGPFTALLAVLSRPYDRQPENTPYRAPPQPGERVTQTFCGT